MVNTPLFAGRERVDLPDLTYATQDAVRSAQEQLVANFVSRQSQSRIVSGFVPSGSGQGPVVVGAVGTANVAILPYLVGSTLLYGRLACDAPVSQAVSVSSLSTGTYSIFIRSTTSAEVTQQRVFWDGSQLKEIAQLTPTRTVAGWEARVESASPGTEWVKIGEVTIASAGAGQGSTINVVDQRPLYFEGTFAGSYRPSWGSDAERGNRRASTITDLATMVDALKQCLVDIKGRGLATWSQPNISGMLIGSHFGLSDNPAADTLYIGDRKFGFDVSTPDQPFFFWNGTADYWTCGRTTGELNRYRSGAIVHTQMPNGHIIIGSGSLGRLYDAALYITRPASPLAYLHNSGSGFASAHLACSDTSGAYLAMSDHGAFSTPRYGIYAAWSANPTFELQSRLGIFLRSVSTAGKYDTSLLASGGEARVQGATVAISASAQLQVFGSTFKWSDRPFVYGMMPFAAGTYRWGNTGVPSIVYSSQPGVTVSNVTDTNDDNRGYGATQEITFAGAAVPANAVVSIQPLNQRKNADPYYRCMAAAINWQGNTLVVQFRNDNNEVIQTDFDFTILVGP